MKMQPLFFNVSDDDIALALGHGSETVTDRYIRKNQTRIDAANNKVISLIPKEKFIFVALSTSQIS